jgi:LAO/AO transport system kinase
MAELSFAVHLHRQSPASPRDIDWEIPVLATEAQRDVGTAELLGEIRRHRAVLEATGALATRRRARRRAEFQGLLVEALRAAIEDRAGIGDLAGTLDRVADGVLDPYTAIETVLARALTGPGPCRSRDQPC